MEHAHNREQQTAKTFCWPALHTAQLALCVCVRIFVSAVCVHYWLLLGYKDFSTTFRNK